MPLACVNVSLIESTFTVKLMIDIGSAHLPADDWREHIVPSFACPQTIQFLACGSSALGSSLSSLTLASSRFPRKLHLNLLVCFDFSHEGREFFVDFTATRSLIFLILQLLQSFLLEQLLCYSACLIGRVKLRLQFIITADIVWLNRLR